MIIKIEGNCKYKGCTEPATMIACGRSDYPKPDCFCEEHATLVAGEGNPEYLNECPNCTCLHGVN